MKRPAFVPVHETARKSKKSREEKISNSIDKLIRIMEDDPTKELVQLLREDSERQAKLDRDFMEIMKSAVGVHNSSPNRTLQVQNLQPPIYHYPSYPWSHTTRN